MADLSKRVVLNSESLPSREYMFINHLVANSIQMFGSAYSTGTVFNSDVVDSKGWPTTSYTVATSPDIQWGFGIALPDSSNFSGPYVLTWTDVGEIQFLTGTWTVNTGLSSGYVEVSNGRYTGTNPYIVLTYSGSGTSSLATIVRQSDPVAIGAYVKDVKFYRLSDETDLLAGKIYRTTWKNIVVNLHPSAIRFMGLYGGNASPFMRFENRNSPANNAWYGDSWRISPPYGVTTGASFAYSLAGVSGTPVSMLNGEVATCRMGNSTPRGGTTTVTAITKANPGVATYSGTETFQNGDVMIFPIGSNSLSGMTELQYLPFTVANLNTGAKTFELQSINTTGFGTFTGGYITQYVTLNVGSRGDYPIIFLDGISPAATNSSGYLNAGSYQTFYFNKALVASTLVSGAWMFQGNAGVSNPARVESGMPLEIMTKMIIELNEICTTNGIAPIDMWVNVPAPAVLSIDSDYTTNSDIALGTVSVILNGANGYSGLPTQCNLFVEYSNETWNFGGSAFSQTPYLCRIGQLRNAAAGQSDNSYATTVRSSVMGQTIVNSLTTAQRTRVFIVASGQGTLGISGTNNARINGNALISADSAYIALGGGSPSKYFDMFSWASYFTAGDTYDTANLATLAAQYAAASTSAQQENICAVYANAVYSCGGLENVTRYQNTLLQSYASTLVALGKRAIEYEGGWDKDVTNNTAQINTYLQAVQRSQAWGSILKSYMAQFIITVGAYMPAILIMINQRWGYAYPDSYLGTTEGLLLTTNPAWSGMSEVDNRANVGRLR